jgi:hypothetical protein
VRTAVTRAVVLTVATGGLAVTAGGSGLLGPDDSPAATTSARLPTGPAVGETRRHRLSERLGCSTEGLAPGVVPGHALLRDADGRVRVTTFERGWAAYAGERPGTLVAVCP